MSEKNEALAAALFKVESVHHIHGNQCLCGFKSHVSRDRTKHIMDVTLEAATPYLIAETAADILEGMRAWAGAQELGFLEGYSDASVDVVERSEGVS